MGTIELKRKVDFSTGKCIVTLLLPPECLGKYLAGDDYEIFIRETDTEGRYEAHVTKIGDRYTNVYANSTLKAETVCGVASDYTIDLGQ